MFLRAVDDRLPNIRQFVVQCLDILQPIIAEDGIFGEFHCLCEQLECDILGDFDANCAVADESIHNLALHAFIGDQRLALVRDNQKKERMRLTDLDKFLKAGQGILIVFEVLGELIPEKYDGGNTIAILVEDVFNPIAQRGHIQSERGDAVIVGNLHDMLHHCGDARRIVDILQHVDYFVDGTSAEIPRVFLFMDKIIEEITIGVFFFEPLQSGFSQRNLAAIFDVMFSQRVGDTFLHGDY